MKQIVTLTTAAASLALVIWLGWLFVTNFQESDPSVKAGLIGLLGLVAAALITHYLTRGREVSARHFTDKREGYMHIIDLIFDLFLSVKNKKKLSESTMTKKIYSFKKALMLWGSSEVINAWDQFETGSEMELSDREKIREMDKVLRAIRRDLGHDDRLLESGSLVGLMLVAKDKKIAHDEK